MWAKLNTNTEMYYSKRSVHLYKKSLSFLYKLKIKPPFHVVEMSEKLVRKKSKLVWLYFFFSQMQESETVYRGTLASYFPRDWEEIRIIYSTVKSGFCF